MSTPFDDLPEKITLEEEQTLIKKGTPEDKVKLVMATMREAVKYCQGLSQNGGEFKTDELISLCYDVLVKSAERFKPGYSRFMAFCKPRLRGAVNRNWKVRDVVKNAKTVPLEEAKAIEHREQKPKIITNDASPGEEEYAAASVPELSSQIFSPDCSEVFQHEELESIQEIVDSELNEHEKMVLNLVYKAGFNFAEVSRFLGVSRAAVQGTGQRAISKIKYHLALRRVGMR
jgi:RNA polymerase sigma factor (sigma-70 family)